MLSAPSPTHTDKVVKSFEVNCNEQIMINLV